MADTITTQDITSVLVTSTPSTGITINRVTGTPTPGSVSLLNLQGNPSFEFDVSGVWTGTLTVERSEDGLTWTDVLVSVVGSLTQTRTLTGNGTVQALGSAAAYVRLRATAAMTGGAVITSRSGAGSVDSAGGGGAGGSVTVTNFPATQAVSGGVVIVDGINAAFKTSVAQFHNVDNQALAGNAYGLLTGGVAQLLNAVGNVDRQRETGSDNISAVGVATGTQQLKSKISVTLTGATVANVTSLTLSATKVVNRGVNAWVQVGSTLTLEPGTNLQEQVVVTAINYTTNAVTVQGSNATNPKGTLYAHASGVSVITASYNESVDATIVDGSSPAGVNAGAAYLFNSGSNNGQGGVEFERSFLGELMGASGVGAAIATEYEDSSGGPVLANGTPSGLRLIPAQSLLGVGLGSGAITAAATGNTSLVFGSAAATNTITAGHAIQLTGGAVPETVFATVSWVPGSSATVPLQSPVVNAGQATARWHQFAANGPGLNGFLPIGIGVEEESVFDPVSGLLYLERSATQDNVPAQNVVLENPSLWNGAGMDRQRGSNAAPTTTGRTAVAIGSGVMTSLNAVTVTGAGVGTNLFVAHQTFALQVAFTGAPTAVGVDLEGSLNGSDWRVLVSSTSVSGDIVWTSGKPVTWVRANLKTLTGGTAPAVTASIVAS